MACARHLGMISTPIVCVNVNNYYEPFRQMLKQAYDDSLIKLKPSEIIHFASSLRRLFDGLKVYKKAQ